MARGETLPSCEGLARWAFARLAADLPAELVLEAAQIDASPGLGARFARPTSVPPG